MYAAVPAATCRLTLLWRMDWLHALFLQPASFAIVADIVADRFNIAITTKLVSKRSVLTYLRCVAVTILHRRKRLT